MQPTEGNANKGAAESRRAMVEKELRQRAAMYYRLRYSKDRALERLRQNVVWDFRRGRPTWLDDGAISAIVDAVYARQSA